MSEQQVTHILKLPSGIQIEAHSGIDQWEKFTEHAVAAISEGKCPLHAAGMRMFPAKPGHAGGKCGACIGIWHADLSSGKFDWSAGVTPYSVELGCVVGGEPLALDWAESSARPYRETGKG